ncbi:hypothetical protein KR51_00026600 [Rubidibacter lacunae KORDI 51-2]|uniref:Uncharacterized protein n=2 Tax=Rubidibacter TaxID=582491 RepID=U5DGF8_9CHRO|nr:hypothetical protein KR51_00026600 [Rubidibacter lacunae KORDI 51-2]
MEEFRVEFSTLQQKVDGLYLAIEQLGVKFDRHMSSRDRQAREDADNIDPAVLAAIESHPRGLDSVVEHKDVLPDSNSGPSVNAHSVSSDIQIRRLNTQLTAAYNRIAALEEQMLARHIHF